MPPRIAIPIPTGFDPEYNDRSWPQYARAVELAGGEPVPIPLNQPPAATARLIESCTGVLLPGSGADVNPQKYGQPLHPASAPPDPARENVDELLLQDAHNMGKPLLAICFGVQMLNVWRGGSLIQDVPPGPVNHKPGRHILEAHPVDIAPHSLLATLLQSPLDSPDTLAPDPPHHTDPPNSGPPPSQDRHDSSEGRHSAAKLQDLLTSLPPAPQKSTHAPHLTTDKPQPGTGEFLQTQVNSSHHQALDAPGDGLFITARSSHDGIIEAVEARQTLSSDRNPPFLLGVQWHPERTYDESPLSRAIFHRFVSEAATWIPRPVTTSVV